ncbi:unnamed protein product [Rotaria sordida]|uniref:Uncharacterized protein n=1 Tax=Rotaria sordida TaxID=392033 RepID=A0A814R074_9BILA|nr:unnamed protein product [Rotaria sordida]
MDSIRRGDRRAKSKQRLQNELEKVLRRSEFANKSFPQETSKGLSTYDYQETTTSSPLTLEDITPMETSHSLDAGAHVDVIEDPVSMTQFPILEDIAEEDDCVMEEADKEGIVLQNDESCFSTLYTERNEPPTMRELSVVLLLLKARHHLTDSCIDDLCSLFIRLGIKNSPMSFQQLKNFLVPRKNVTDLVESRVCNECASLSQGKTQCRNPNCKLFGSFIKYPTEFLHFPIEFQLLSILSRTKIKFYKNDIRTSPATELSDVCDGAVYRKLVRTQRDPFIILTLNINGISIFQSSNRSIWIFTAAINEVARQDRFKLNNMLILAISSSLCDKASTGKTMICVFPTAPTITYSLRTNEWYDQMIETVCNPDVRQRTAEDEILEMLCGHKVKYSVPSNSLHYFDECCSNIF